MSEETGELGRRLGDLKVVLSIDRLDYSKGIVPRLKGYAKFLEDNPEWLGKVVLLCVVVPSRTSVERYHKMRGLINELVGEINGRFGSVHWTPIIYQYRLAPFSSVAAMYSVSDVALVTPLRDGMNLIAKEYLAARSDQTGVLILSEMAGASRELGEAIIVNPNSVSEIAEGIKSALEISVSEQMRRNQVMRSRLRSHDIVRWGQRLYSHARDREGGQFATCSAAAFASGDGGNRSCLRTGGTAIVAA